MALCLTDQFLIFFRYVRGFPKFEESPAGCRPLCVEIQFVDHSPEYGLALQDFDLRLHVRLRCDVAPGGVVWIGALYVQEVGVEILDLERSPGTVNP